MIDLKKKKMKSVLDLNIETAQSNEARVSIAADVH